MPSHQQMIIMKIGGSCLRTSADFLRLRTIVQCDPHLVKVIVVSALYGVTDMLISVMNATQQRNPLLVQKTLFEIETLHAQIILDLFYHDAEALNTTINDLYLIFNEIRAEIVKLEQESGETKNTAKILTFGEILSCFLLTAYLQKENLQTTSIIKNPLIVVDDEPNVNFSTTQTRIRYHLSWLNEQRNSPQTVCIPGFIAQKLDGTISSLGRGGSDYTATILAKVFYECGWFENGIVMFWKDVDGIYNQDPFAHPDAKLLHKIPISTAIEMVHAGSKILHPDCLQLVQDLNIRLQLRNFLKEDQTIFTEIGDDR